MKASYEVRSSRRIALTFEAAEVSDVQIGPRVESAIAPALLPRSWINHRVLMAIKEVGDLLTEASLLNWAAPCTVI